MTGQLDGKLVYWLYGFMKTTLDLPDDLVKELKLRSVHERSKLKDVAAAALRRGLAMDAKSQQPRKKGIKLPFFECGPDVPAAKMTTEELIALEQKVTEEEDLKRAGLSL